MKGLKKIVKIKNIRHTGIVVKNLNKSLNFYKNLLGFKIKKRMIESGKATDKLSRLKKTKIETVKMIIGKNSDMIELLYFHSHKRNVKLTFCRAPEGTLIEIVQELN